MPPPLSVSGCRIPSICSLRSLQSCGFTSRRISRVRRDVRFCSKKELPAEEKVHRLCATAGDGQAKFSAIEEPIEDSNAHKYSADLEGSKENSGSQPGKASASNELMQRLRRYGISGVLSYGLLNTAYYITTFILVWFYIAPAPGRLGYAAAVARFFKVMAMVWAGSQVTKLVRAGGALVLAPFVDRGLSWFTVKFKFQSQGKAFMAIVGVCLGLALLLFFVLTLLWS